MTEKFLPEMDFREIFERNADQIRRAMYYPTINCRCVTQEIKKDSAMDFSTIYNSLVSDVMDGEEEMNTRTNTTIRMLEGASFFKLDLSDGKLPVPNNRKYFPHIAAAEAAWQFMGTKDPSFIIAWAPKLWSKFLNDDGELETAYGYRWMSHFGRDQLQLALLELRDNPSNRQLYISAWDPAKDGLGGEQPKNIPCPLGFTLSACNGKLHMSVHVRSSDVFVGLPYDVMGYALTLDAIASTLEIKPGTMSFTLAHPHIYKPHWGFAKPELSNNNNGQGTHVSAHQPNLPGWTIDMILEQPVDYVETVRRLSRRVNQHPWNPMPEVIE